MTQYNGGLYDITATSINNFLASGDFETTSKTIASGVVLKKGTLLESDTVGKLIPHTGVSEKALVVFADIALAAKTVILGGLTFTTTAACSKEELVTAFSNLTSGTGYAAANTANPVSNGSFTAGTFTGWTTIKSSTADGVLFSSTTPNSNVTNLADTGNGSATTITITAGQTIPNRVAGILAYDLDASSADTDALVYVEGTFFADSLVWSVNPATDTIENVSMASIACTDYYTGATSKLLKDKLVEASEIKLVHLSTGETYA